MDKALFNYYAQRRNDSRKDIAEALQISVSTLGNKISGRFPFSVAEIRILKARWSLSADDISKIFLI